MDANLLGPIINVGAVGCCLIVLAVYYIKKDKKYEARIDERLVREKEHQKEVTDLTEKYRLAMENVSKSLDAVIRIIPNRGGSGA
jgi:hypothetical protein